MLHVVSPWTHADHKQGKTRPCKWAWQGKQFEKEKSIVINITNSQQSGHSWQSLAMNILLDEEIDTTAVKSSIFLKCDFIIIVPFRKKLTQFRRDDEDDVR